MKGTLVVIGLIGLLIFTSGGCDKNKKGPVDVHTTITIPANKPSN